MLLPMRLCAIAILNSIILPTIASAAPDVSGKVVLANLDRYEAYLKVGDTRRVIKPRKASVLTPKRYPVTIEFWSGNTRGAWRKQTIAKAGTYAFNFKHGNWSLTELRKSTTTTVGTRPGPRVITRPSPKIIRQQVITRPVRRLPINVDRNRWSPLARAVYAAGQHLSVCA